MTNPRFERFPFDVLRHLDFPGSLGDDIRALRPWSMIPPYPWGQWTYGRLYRARCRKLAGDVAEFGVGLGGMSIFLGRLAQRDGKRLWSFDSFEGLPPPDPEQDNRYFQTGDYGLHPARNTSLRARFDALVARTDLKDTIRVRQGFFEETLPRLPKRSRLSFVHIDADLYSSVLTVLEHVYDRVVDGGVIAIDDYFHHAQGPARAVSTFFRRRGVDAVFHIALPYSVVIIKGERPRRAMRPCLDGQLYSVDLLRADRELSRAVEQSVRRARGTEASEPARQFRSLLERTQDSSADLYVFQQTFAAFWDLFASGPTERTKILL